MHNHGELWSVSNLSMDVEGVLVPHVLVEFLLPAPSLLLFVELPLRSLVGLEDQDYVDYPECHNEEAEAELDVVKLRDRAA